MKFCSVRKISVCLIFTLSFISLTFSQSLKLKIIETSDVHGAILPYDLVNDTSSNSSLAQIQSYLNVERSMPDQEVVLLDNGDILQGDPLVYYYNYEDTSNYHIYAAAMNLMKYDAATIGNHDIETGHLVYDKFRKKIFFPWLAANAINTKTGEPYFKPYSVLIKGGVKIAVLGLITPGIPKWLPKQIWEGIEFEDMITAAKKWVQIIEEKENPDLLIGLFHSGVDYTYDGETAETYRNENASKLVAEQVPGFDLIFVGHDHHGWNFKTVNNNGDSILVLGPLSRARTFSVATVQMKYDLVKNKWVKSFVFGENIKTSQFRPDSHFMTTFLIKLNIVGHYVAKPLGIIKKTISARESLFGPSRFVDLIHAFQLEKTRADISFVSPLSFDAQIDSGWIYVRDMFKLYRYENFLYTMKLSGNEIKNYLEFSYANWFNQMKSANDNLLNFKKDKNGNIIYSERSRAPQLVQRYYNFSSAAGLEYTVDVSKPANERVTILSLSDGDPFYEDSIYTVAINSYRGNGGGGHLTRGAGLSNDELSMRVIKSTDKDLRYYMMKWIEKKKFIYPELIGNWKIIPEQWWTNGKEKDYNILFK